MLIIQRPCPCCSDDMEAYNVVCWACYYATNRLQPGVHLDPNGTTTTNAGYAITISQAQIDRWDTERQSWS